MTTKATWLDLAERCEKAAGPDREIDGLIAKILGDLDHYAVFARGDMEGDFWFVDEPYAEPAVAKITASLDAIAGLIDRELPGTSWRIHWRGIGKNCTGWIERLGRGDDPEFSHEWGDATGKRYTVGSPALALCAAFCHAMGERSTE